MLHFTMEEFNTRLIATRSSLEKRGLDALLIFSQESHYYLTGYDTGGYKFFQCAVLTTSPSPITLLARPADFHQARLTSTIEDIRIYHMAERGNPAQQLRDILEEKGLHRKRIGIELATHGLTAANWEMVREALAGWCHFEDASDIVWRQRLIKSEQEQAFVRRAAAIADEAILAVLRTACPGADESDIELAVTEVALKAGGDVTLAKVILSSGPNVMMTKVASGSRTMHDGDQLTLEWAGIFRRYHAGILRTFAIGHAIETHKEFFRVTNDALQAITEAARPGRPIGKIDEAHRRVFDDAGYSAYRLSSAGYAVGATFPPKGLPDTPPFITADSTLIAEPGMTFFVHPMIMDTRVDGVMMLGYTLLITSTGCEVLSQLPIAYHECM
ncbi:Xaa-Pro peptidase family protein [Mesorhizobium sp. M1E.F.Ca.ET.041.01.1.1]|uniref:M24 family metallopeptidase n=1 Tax=Mesorhizobium sp. M1E.F.Ca.ET.041.01.1.1 TaxID=2496759 RepID=UPI00167C0486|nr:Xaa-Pro peptidase family protein [Mesorhizobium sp. M1E.F.Ca.ET.041.01.1.1]